ncbi:MAG: VWA domain-containing protein, partial [Propionibacteriaceae bacterium]|nr:VWA domain-containing protein [Propionibacteriaceae bacterium]
PEPEPEPPTPPHQPDQPDQPEPPGDVPDGDTGPSEPTGAPPVAPSGVAEAAKPFRPRELKVRGVGSGAPGRRSRAITTWGRTVGASNADGRVHLVATLTAAAPHQTPGAPIRFRPEHVRTAVTQGKESNLILFAVDASGSMAARRRMGEVKTAVLSLLMDAYQRRDRVGLVTFRGGEASLSLPPTRSVEAAARCLADLPHGGRTPLAEGLTATAHTLQVERTRDPNQRALVVLVTDGRATAGENALARARQIADAWAGLGTETIVVDCESGRFRLGLAADFAARMGASYLPLAEVAAQHLVDAVRAATAPEMRRSA